MKMEDFDSCVTCTFCSSNDGTSDYPDCRDGNCISLNSASGKIVCQKYPWASMTTELPTLLHEMAGRIIKLEQRLARLKGDEL